MATENTTQQPADDPITYLYSKKYTCPVCMAEFEELTVRRSKLRQVSMDTDFRTIYRAIDPNLYEVIFCNTCGYAALLNYFDRITPKQQDWIKEKITPNHKYTEFSAPFTPADGLTRYKRAIACAQAINAKTSQKAILCLKMAWICRDIKDEKNEQALLRMTYNGLKEAFTSENFPIGNMDEPTVKYMIAELARRLGEYEEALRMIGDVIVTKGVPHGLKERAQNLKELIRENAEAAKG